MLDAIARSLRHKFALAMLAATFVSLSVAGTALALYELQAYKQNVTSDLLTQAEILGRATGPALAFDDHKSAEENLSLLETRRQIRAAAIYNARGRMVARYRAAGAHAEHKVPALPEADGVRLQDGELVVFKRILENKEIVGTVYMSADYELAQRFRGYLGILASVMGLSLLVAAGISAWLQSALTKPILAVTNVARQVTERKDFSLRVQKTTKDELGYLADAFNDMLSEIGRRADDLETANRALEREAQERQRADQDVRQLNAELEQRVSQRTLQLETANQELESFSYSVSHDLRAPLRWIVGFSEALMEDHGANLDDEARRKIQIIQNEGRRMGVLIDDLLAFSRLGRRALKVSDVEMGALVLTTWNALKEREDFSRVQLHVGAMPVATGDRVLLGQVWTNLLSNALKFSSKQENPRIEIGAITDDQEHIFFVRDNGAGFNPKYKAKLFGVFQRLHDTSEFPGTGVGLALVQRIVHRHGGRVWADGNLGEGATFYFTVPRESRDGAV
jgi:signal transduction histidine kinase